MLPEVLLSLCQKAGCTEKSPAAWLHERLSAAGHDIKLRTVHWWFQSDWPRPSDAARGKLVEALRLDEEDELHLYRVISAGQQREPVSIAS